MRRLHEFANSRGGKKPEKWRFDVRIIDASFGPTVEKKSLKTFGNCAGFLVIRPFDHRGLKQQRPATAATTSHKK